MSENKMWLYNVKHAYDENNLHDKSYKIESWMALYWLMELFKFNDKFVYGCD